MKIVFLVPCDYKKIGGLYLPIDNQKRIMEQMGHTVKIVGITYHPNNKEIEKLIRTLKKLEKDGFKHIVSYTLLMSYTLVKRCARYLPYCDITCFLVDSMKLNARSIIDDLHFGKQYFIELLKLIKYSYQEKYILKNIKRVGYVSPVDINYVKSTYKRIKSRIFCVPNGTNLYSNKATIVEPNTPLKIGVLAGASEKTNHDNLFPFLLEAFPLIRKRHPNIEFIIAGKINSSKDVDIIKSQKNTVYLGFVEALSDFYDRVDIVITTVKKECGVLNRVLEAWAFGKAVIGFEKNFKGFEYAQKNKDYLVANNWDDFDRLIDGIIQGTVDINFIAHHSNVMVQKSYSWETSTNRLIKMIGW